jgi:endonuclease YncB( thermonuclease family)
MSKYLFMFLLAACVFNNAQEVVISKIIDTNLFELSDGQKIKLYGLEIPSLNVKDPALKKVAEEIIENVKQIISNRQFVVKFVDEENGIKRVKLFKNYSGNEINISEWFLSNGLATMTLDNEDARVLEQFEKKGMEEKRGIWKGTKENNLAEKFVTADKLTQLNKQYEQPYLYMLGVSIASAALAWDYFSQAGDIQDNIDLLKSMAKSAKITIDTKTLEDSKTRKTIIGVTCVAASILSTIFAIKNVEVKSEGNRIALSYRF